MKTASIAHMLGVRLLALTAFLALSSISIAAQTLPRPDHIVIVVEENHTFDQIVGESKAPYINSLIKEGALLTKYYATRHPSQPNYFVLFSGDDQGVKNDDCDSKAPKLTVPSLGGQLIAKGLTFIGYADGLPSVGSKKCKSGRYRRKHAPWISFADVPDEASIPFTEFPTDFERLPTIAFVIPDMVNDMHDGMFGKRRRNGDNWLKKYLNDYKEWAKTHNSLLIVTWDEDDKLGWIVGEQTEPPANHIATIFVGEMVRPGATSDREYTHVDLLRTLLEMYGLPLLPKTEDARVINDIWK